MQIIFSCAPDTMYMLQMAHLDIGQRLKGENLLAEMEQPRKTIMEKEGVDGPSKWEENFDELANF